MALLKRLLQNNLHDHVMSRDVTNEFIYAIIATIKRTLQQLDLKLEDVFEAGSILYLDFKYYETPDQLVEGILDCFTKFFAKASGDADPSRSTTESIPAYIRENYDKDLSINDISEHFDISAGHVSRLLKNNVGSTFKDYLNHYRVQ